MVVEQKAIFDKGAMRLLYKNARKNSTFRRNKSLLALAGVILVVLGVLRVNDIILTGMKKGYGVAGIILGIVAFGLLVGTYIFLWRTVNNDAKSAMEVNATYKIDENGLRTRTNVGRNDFSWDKLKVKEHKGYVEIVVDCVESSVFLKKDKLKEKEIKWILSENKPN